MLKLQVEYYLQLEDVKQYYFLHDAIGIDGTKNIIANLLAKTRQIKNKLFMEF